MKRISWAALLSAATLTVALAASPVEQQPGRDWTIQDSIGVRYFAVQNPRLRGVALPPGWIRGYLESDEVATFSPDRKYFFFTSFHGDLARDEMVYELCVFAVDEVRRAIGRKASTLLTPKRELRFASAYSDE